MMVRLALISDIHFGDMASSNEFVVPGQTAKGETAGAVSMSESLIQLLEENRVQYLFVCGDLTSRAKPQEFHYCAEKILSIAKGAGIPAENIVWGVGNHDVDWNITKLAEAYKSEQSEIHEIANQVYRLLAVNAAASAVEQIPMPQEKGPVPMSGIVETKDFVAFVLNSALYCTHDQEFSHGRLGEEQLAWFRSTAPKYTEDRRWKIVLMHHHPHNYAYHTPVADISALEDGSEFVEIAAENGIQLVLHGHRHHPRAVTRHETDWDDPITFICAGSLSVNSDHRSQGAIPNTFHIIELTDTRGVLNLFNFEYSLSEGWRPLSWNRRETPLDAKMKLGRTITAEVVESKIRSLAGFEGDYCILRWEELDEDLQYKRYAVINDKMNELLSPCFTISGKFPDIVCLIRKGGNRP